VNVRAEAASLTPRSAMSTKDGNANLAAVFAAFEVVAID
jgi:hypothetical protein